MVDFPRPGEAAREAIWRKLLAAVKLPQADGIDARRLAKANELTGAEILRCVRAASLIAAVDERKIDMELLQTVASERVAMRERTAE
jgi:SpoVK/Ycf46/Vps4 family AAA+-type ATPase